MWGSGSQTEPSCERRGWWQSKTRRAMCRWATASPQLRSAPLRQLQTMAARERATEQTRTARVSTGATGVRTPAARALDLSVKVSQLAELKETVVDLLPGELGNALGAKALHGKGAHDAAVEHGASVRVGS